MFIDKLLRVSDSSPVWVGMLPKNVSGVIGRLYGGDFLFIPYEGEENIKISLPACSITQSVGSVG